MDMNKKQQKFYVWKTDKDWNPIEENNVTYLTAPSLRWAVDHIAYTRKGTKKGCSVVMDDGSVWHILKYNYEKR